MTDILKLKQFLIEQEGDEALIDLIPTLQTLLPEGVKFEMDVWNLFEWKTRKGNAKTYNIFFDKIKNDRLKDLIKIYFLEKRQSKDILAESIRAELYALNFIDKALGPRPFDKLSNNIFYEAQEMIIAAKSHNAAERSLKYLEVYGSWMTSNLGSRISYKSSLLSTYLHGRKASDKDRDNKLIDSRITIDLINSLHKEDLILKDQFYLLIFVLVVGTGIRVEELATLPKDCLVREGENVGIRFFPVKKPQLDTRWLMPEWVAPAEDAIKKLTELTDEGRGAVAKLRKKPGLDWPDIMQNEEAAQYFVEKFCYEWTSNEKHNMFNKTGAWVEKKKCYIDIIKLVKKAGSKSQAAKEIGLNRKTLTTLLLSQQAALNNELPPKAKGAKKGKREERISWDTDSRVISVVQLEEKINLKINKKSRDYFIHIIEDARDSYQLKGKVYPRPSYNKRLEKQFKRTINPVITSRNGIPILQPEDTLLVTLKYQLTDARSTKIDDFQFISTRAICRWLSGETRSFGTKNTEDSCFSRLEIFDPKTNEIAKFTTHDIRHWLTTFLLEGGMPNDQVALLFNRSPNQNDTYDQTSSKTRLNNMRQAIRDGGAMGHVADTFHNIAEYSREEAEQYLKASTLQLNLMPHGGCSLNWGMSACESHNGCFNSEDGVCEHLCIDPDNAQTKQELNRMQRESELALNVIPEQSPQYNHYLNIQRNLKGLCGGSIND